MSHEYHAIPVRLGTNQRLAVRCSRHITVEVVLFVAARSAFVIIILGLIEQTYVGIDFY